MPKRKRPDSLKNTSFVLRFLKISLCAMETFLFEVVCGFSVALYSSRLRNYEFLSFIQVNAIILLYYELTLKSFFKNYIFAS